MRFLVGLFVAAALYEMVKWLVVLALLVTAAYMLNRTYQLARTRKALAELNLEMYCARADLQNAAYLYEGDIYGDYQPATMPLTQPKGWHE